MRQDTFKKIGFAIVAIVTVGIWALLVWEHYHGGVASHSLFARKDMPSISNWWGGLLLPLVTYFSLHRIQERTGLLAENSILTSKQLQSILLLFFGGLLYALSMVHFYNIGNSTAAGVLFQGLFVLALLAPIYKVEFFLGFVIGLTYSFGAILPTFIALGFVTLSYVAHRYIYPFTLKISGYK